MNILISVGVLITLFILYKYTNFFNKKRHKTFQYLLIIILASLALIDVAIANNSLKYTGFSLIVIANIVLALLLFFSSLKVMK